MASDVKTIIDSLATSLQTQSDASAFVVPITASAAWSVRVDLDDMTGAAAVFVSPLERKAAMDSRGELRRDLVIEVCIQRKLVAPEDTTLDQCMQLHDEIEAWLAANVTTISGYGLLGLNVTLNDQPQMQLAEYHELQQFTSYIYLDFVRVL